MGLAAPDDAAVYKLSDEQFKKYVERIKEDNKFESDEQFQAALKAENLTMAELRSRVEVSMITQTVIGQESIKQMEMAGEEPDVIVGCCGGGSNFAGIAFPFMQRKIKEGKQYLEYMKKRKQVKI